MNKVSEILEEQIKKEFKKLSTLESGTLEKTAATENLVALYRLRIDELKNEIGGNEQAKDRKIKFWLTLLEVVLPLIFYGIWMERGLLFEETGTFSSTVFKGLINCFRPKK